MPATAESSGAAQRGRPWQGRRAGGGIGLRHCGLWRQPPFLSFATYPQAAATSARIFAITAA